MLGNFHIGKGEQRHEPLRPLSIVTSHCQCSTIRAQTLRIGQFDTHSHVMAFQCAPSCSAQRKHVHSGAVWWGHSSSLSTTVLQSPVLLFYILFSSYSSACSCSLCSQTDQHFAVNFFSSSMSDHPENHEKSSSSLSNQLNDLTQHPKLSASEKIEQESGGDDANGNRDTDIRKKQVRPHDFHHRICHGAKPSCLQIFKGRYLFWYSETGHPSTSAL